MCYNNINVKEEKKLLNLALKYKEELNQNDFNAIVNFCYSRIAQKKFNNSIEKYITPTYNKIIKRAIEK